ncbi:MAG TPA: MurR/RpiR family transcriptional regulator [Firmicutes bacterium]|nr:MurR/RpiR family transcriptional regulator [Bacillota bacterium]
MVKEAVPLTKTPFARMAELLPNLKGANLRLAQWYLDAFGAGQPLPLNHHCDAVAETVGVSRASVIRFARLLGYSGFSTFRNALFQADGSPNAKPAEELQTIASGDKPSSLVEATQLQIAALQAGLQAVDAHAFTSAAEWIAKASSILWIGWGDSYFAAAGGEHKCHLAGLPARSANDVADLRLHVSMLDGNGLVIVLSQSGRWSTILDAVRQAQLRGIRVICLTGTASSILAQSADIAFITPNPTLRVAGHPFTMRAAQITLIDALILAAVRLAGKVTVEPVGSVQ